MEGDVPEYAEAVVVRDRSIVFVGTLNAAKRRAPDGQEVDLNGKTLVPGFVDGHCHFFGFGAQAIMANLLASPDGNVNNIDDLIQTSKQWFEDNGTDLTQGWIVGIGYDDAVLEEKRHPTREDLDKISTDLPVIVIHISGHFASVNSKGLKMIGYTSETPDPEGGVIRRIAGTNEPNGVLEELAAIPVLFERISPTDKEVVDIYLDAGQKMAASYGYTTAQEGRAMTNHQQMADYAQRDKFYLDVVSYVDYAFKQQIHSDWTSKDYKKHYRIGGIKLTLDGSPQGRTAWRTEPYLLPPDGQEEGYAGYPVIPNDQDVTNIVDTAFANDWQLLVHCNGDAAADQLFRCIDPAIEKYGNEDRRTTLIHGQLLRKDQLDEMKERDIVASLFPMHTFYWGDWYKKIIGPDKAEQISPIRSALDRGLHITSHTDAPVALPNLMMIMHTTVNRVTRSGDVIGKEERLTPYEALKSITIWGAYQHFEENTKGSLAAGKLADLVILSENPLKVDPMTLKDIEVLQTIKEGKTIFKRS